MKGRNKVKKCSCPKCDYEMDHKRGVPCSENKCPKCDVALEGEYCKEDNA